MKFSYSWIRDLSMAWMCRRALERLITMKTAECEGVEDGGRAAGGGAVGGREMVESGVEADRQAKHHNVKASARRWIEPMRVRLRKDRGVRRAELPRRA